MRDATRGITEEVRFARGPQRRGSGRDVAAYLRGKLDKPRRCRRCLIDKSAREFVDSYARKCVACSTCAWCAGPHLGEPHLKTCSPECAEASRVDALERAIRASARKRTRAAALRTTKQCPACGVSKPKSVEHFSPTKRDPETGGVLRWAPYCKPCTRAEVRDRHANDPVRRAKHRAYAKRYRERRRREGRSVSGTPRAARRTAKLPSEPEVIQGHKKQHMARLPARPLVALIDSRIEAERRSYAVADPDGVDPNVLEQVCASFGVSPRSLNAWRRGEVAEVLHSVADRVLTMTGLNWWDVWDEDEFPEVAECLAA